MFLNETKHDFFFTNTTKLLPKTHFYFTFYYLFMLNSVIIFQIQFKTETFNSNFS